MRTANPSSGDMSGNQTHEVNQFFFSSFFPLSPFHFHPLSLYIQSQYVCLSLGEAAFVLHVHHPLVTSVYPCTNNLHKHGGLNKHTDAHTTERVHTLTVKDDEPWLNMVYHCICSTQKEILIQRVCRRTLGMPRSQRTLTHRLLRSHAFDFSSALCLCTEHLSDSHIRAMIGSNTAREAY